MEKPWGGYIITDTGIDWLTKRIIIQTGQETSLQYHQKRSEYIIVISGIGRAEINDKRLLLERGTVAHIPLGAEHRLKNFSLTDPLILIEVQLGQELSEDDIVRLEDKYGRI